MDIKVFVTIKYKLNSIGMKIATYYKITTYIKSYEGGLIGSIIK